MLTRWGDIDSTFRWMDEVRRSMDRRFAGYHADMELPAARRWPRTNTYDTGAELVVRSALPGMSAKDIQVSVDNNVLTIRGERKLDSPEGYKPHRQERSAVQFSRSFSLPCKVDVEKVAASVKNGLLTVRLAKVPEAQPRQITVTAS